MGGFSGECPGITAIHVTYADLASSNRTVLLMANTVVTAALLCLLLCECFKHQQILVGGSWKNDILKRSSYICTVKNGELWYTLIGVVE